MPSFAPLRTGQATPLGRRAPHRLAYVLLNRIKAGVFARGDWLPTEHALMAEFPVSRTTLREALIILECLGVVESHHGVGSQVISGRLENEGHGSAFDLVALLQACRAFEVEAAGLTASLDEKESAPLRPCPSLSGPITTEACRDFHTGLARATGNGAISISIAQLWDAAVARPTIRDPLNVALAREGRAVRARQTMVVDALMRRSSLEARHAVGALFDTYLAAVVDIEEQDRLTRIPLDGIHGRQRWNRGAIAAAPSRLARMKT
ncbi:FadR/GntR family transcriptional regulator [Caulobacter sp. RL271]|uniref:GntR family transcriptional regulator n=1 Tax=Caulobacter segnis TaxID=88688 RepID=A0ABY5A1N7_9CAUL|nr:GntR family transcriptional regulator [Caulobacter segnis]USQ98046.1 GntR family transcriptional regulator [Caulobacter segnis]